MRRRLVSKPVERKIRPNKGENSRWVNGLLTRVSVFINHRREDDVKPLRYQSQDISWLLTHKIGNLTTWSGLRLCELTPRPVRTDMCHPATPSTNRVKRIKSLARNGETWARDVTGRLSCDCSHQIKNGSRDMEGSSVEQLRPVR